MLGVFLIYMTFGTLDFRAVQNAAATMPIETVHFGVLSFICLFLFVGATGKSAQIPLYVWLPDAMEGPTPVSALIHAATMVTAGVYMVGRNAVLFSHAPQVMTIVAIVGVLTALMAASIGLVQYDIKRVLAYSTVSQLGYMFTAMGVGAFSAGAFHLMTHAFFKALLFLGSGSVIHAMGGEQDMRQMGNLKKYMPVTFATMMIGTLAIAGIPPFAGFFCKDEILFQAFLHNKFIWVLAVATALMTAFYMFRLMAMTFFGAYRGPAWETGHGARRRRSRRRTACSIRPTRTRTARRAKKDHEVIARPGRRRHGTMRTARMTMHGAGHGHGPWHGPHESPSPMTFPLLALAVGAIVAGFVGIPAGARRRQHDRTLPRAELHRGSPAEAGHDRSRQRRPGRQCPAAAGPCRRAEHEAEPHVSRGVELGLMGFSVLIAVDRHLRRAEVLRDEPGDLRAARRAVRRARTACSRNKYYVDELYNATVIAGTFAAATRPVGRRSHRRRRRGQRRRQAHRDRLLVLGPDRSHGRRRPGQPGRLDRAGVEPRVPPLPDRPRPELRAVDAVRHLRVRRHVSVCEMTLA